MILANRICKIRNTGTNEVAIRLKKALLPRRVTPKMS